MRTTIVVSYDAGWGNHLTLRGGSPLSWESGRAMSSLDHCTWQLELELENPIEFKPLLNDKVWAFGHRDYRVEPGETLRIFPHFLQTPGWADAIGYIPFKGRDISVRLYTPPGYRENAGRRYPVLYCLDGESLFEGIPDWHLDETLNALIQARAVEPLLVVGVDFAERRAGQPGTPSDRQAHPGGKAEEFASFVLKLKQTIDRTYPTLTDASHTGVMGASMGGLLALWLSRRHPEVFSRTAALSPSCWWASPEVLQEIPTSDTHRGQMLYLDCEGEEVSETVKKLAKSLVKEGWVEGETLAVEVLDETPHKGQAWGGRIGGPLRFLFPWSGR